MTRKGSDVLLSIEAQNEEILEYVRSINHKFSLVLNRLNLHDLAAPVAQPSSPKVKKDESPVFKEAVVEEPKPTVEAPVQAPTVEPAIDDNGGKKRVVIQQVVSSIDEKPIPIAKIRIFNLQGEKVFETRTGPRGKWRVDLLPGKYAVHINKSKYRGYPQINVQNEIVVEAGSEPQMLERLELP